ncbi:unnamed protein product [Adineta ricciae]|nr:unnamed protein product [Adineta ricciae]
MVRILFSSCSISPYSFYLLGFSQNQIRLDDRLFSEKTSGILAYPQCLRGTNRALSDPTIDKVVKSSREDGISRTSSNSKDTIKINSQSAAVRFLEMTASDAYRTFNEQHPGLVARSTFNALRPREVKTATRHDTGICIIHENIDLFFKAWNNDYQKCASIGALSATNKINMKDLINQMVCPGSNEKCFSGKCNNCSSKNDSFVTVQIDFSMNYTLIRQREVQQGFFS